MDKRPARKQNRIKDYDYSQCGAYFVTVCAKGRKNVFGTIPPYIGGGPVFATVQLSECGIIAQNELKNIPNHYENVDVDCFVVMPNHIHAIIVINAPEPTAYIPPQTNAGTAPPIVGARFIAPAVTVAPTLHAGAINRAASGWFFTASFLSNPPRGRDKSRPYDRHIAAPPNYGTISRTPHGLPTAPHAHRRRRPPGPQTATNERRRRTPRRRGAIHRARRNGCPARPHTAQPPSPM
jgi:REP element-mobilizing transposase RayT